jgi:predicted ATPase with chaperone activity
MTTPETINAELPVNDKDYRFVPPVPESIADLEVPRAMIEQLVLKILYFRGDRKGRQLANSLGLDYSVAEPVIEDLKRQHLIVVKSSLGIGNISATFSLTDAARELARQYAERSAYSGRIPVPLAQYAAGVQLQRHRSDWLSIEMLRKAFGHMVVDDRLLWQVGPAVNSGKSFLIYGQPGNGKTFLAEALFNVESDPIYIPAAIECQGQIIQLYDPVYHFRIDEDEPEVSAFARERQFDGRWLQVRRPFIVSGGELTLDMLDLSFNPGSKCYDAPLHLKANNGIYLVDDFGRQRVSPAEVLNRWIVPMERRIDFLNFTTGGKAQVPFETFLIFSSNLKPEQLGDEAFLRRIQYKMLVRSPDEAEFVKIFRRFAQSEGLEVDPAVLDSFIDKHYHRAGKKFRRCHPRDVLTHAIDLIRFERLEFRITAELLDRAFEVTFVAEEHDD